MQIRMKRDSGANRLGRMLLALAVVMKIMAGTLGSAECSEYPAPIDAPLNSGVCGRCGPGFRIGISPGRGTPTHISGNPVHISNQEGTVVEVPCESGKFRAPLRAGKYFLERGAPAAQPRALVAGRPFEVRNQVWTRLDSLSEAECPDSGIYGLDHAVCRGAPDSVGTYPCIKILTPEGGSVIARGKCSRRSAEFAVPLSPGKYVVEFANQRQKVQVMPGRWTRAGVMKVPPCGGRR